MAVITEARLVGDWRRIVGDHVVSFENVDQLDDVGVTGTVTLTPNFGKGPQGVLADDASLYTAHEIKCRVMWGRLHDNDLNNPWQDLIVAVDGKPIVWTAAFSLTYKWRSDVQAQKINLPQVTFDSSAILAGEISLTSLIPSAQIPSNYQPYLVSAQASAQVASDAKTVAELSATAASEAKADAEQALADAAQAKTDAETAAALATTEADRAVGLATAQDQAVADTVTAGGPTTTALNATYALKDGAGTGSATLDQGRNPYAIRPDKPLVYWAGTAAPVNGVQSDLRYNSELGSWQALGAASDLITETPTIVRRAVGSTNSGLSVSATLPVPASAGNTLVALALSRSGNAVGGVSAPAGWTLAASVISEAGSNAYLTVWTKTAVAGDSTFTLSATTSNALFVTLLEVSGATTTVNGQAVAVSSGLTTTATVGPSSAPQVGDLALAVVGANSTLGTFGLAPAWSGGFVHEGDGNTGGGPSMIWASQKVAVSEPLSTTVSWETARINTALIVTFAAKTVAVPSRPALGGLVYHWLNDLHPRPAVPVARWIGAVAPANMAAEDSWQDTAMRFTVNQNSGQTFRSSYPMPWLGSGTPRWVYGDEAVVDGDRAQHTWATNGPHEVAYLLPGDPSLCRGSVHLPGMGLTGDIADVAFPSGLDDSIQIHDNALHGDLAKCPLPQGLTGTFSVRNNSGLYGDVAAIDWPQGLTNTWHLFRCQFTGELHNAKIPQGLTYVMYLSDNYDLTGDIGRVAFPPRVETLTVSTCDLYGDITQARIPSTVTTLNFYSNRIVGDLSQLVLPAGLTKTLYLHDNLLHGALDVSQIPAINEINLDNNDLTTADVDATIASIYDNRQLFTTAGHSLRIGGRNADPSAAGLSMIAELTDPAATGFLPWVITH